MNTSPGPQRQRHGVKKKLVEGAGGLLVGAALVVFMRALVKGRQHQRTPPASENHTCGHRQELEQQQPTASA